MDGLNRAEQAFAAAQQQHEQHVRLHHERYGLPAYITENGISGLDWVSLKKYEIAFDESESVESLRSKLAEFYARRTITRRPISTPSSEL